MPDQISLGAGIGLWVLAAWSASLGLIALFRGEAAIWPGRKALSGRITGLEYIVHAGALLVIGLLIATNSVPIPLVVAEVALLSAGVGLHVLARPERAKARS